MPVYTPMTSSSYRARRFALQNLQNQRSAPLYYFSPAYWGGYGWNPYLFGFGGGFFSDPFDSPFFTGTGCLTFSPFANPFFGPSLSCSNWSAPGLFDPNCPLCNTLGFNSFAPGLNNPSFLYPSRTLPPASASLFSGAASSSSTAPTVPAASQVGSSAPASEMRSSPFAINQPAPGEPLTLVFAGGKTLRATEYWLGNDGRLHYVTASGKSATVPLGALDMAATMEANREKGVQFLGPEPEGDILVSEPASELNPLPFAINQPAPGEPLTLVFAGGKTLSATEYWLGNDGRLHYATASGKSAAVPLGALDMAATMEANREKGVPFLAPAPASTAPPQNP